MGVKKAFLLYFPIIFGLSISVCSQDIPCDRTIILTDLLYKYHYNPIETDQIHSGEIFDSFISRLDPYNSIFTSGDIHALESYRTQLFSHMHGEQACMFLKTISELYLKKLLQEDTMISAILEKPFDFTINDSITFDRTRKTAFAVSDQELEKRRVRRLKYKALNMLFTPVGEEDPIKMENKQLLFKEPEVRKKLGIQWKRFLQRIIKYPSGYESFVAEQFFNTIANRYDPHTQYLSLAGKEQFLTSLSKEAKSFGLSCNEGKNGDSEIGYLNPGGPAWKSNQLHQGDVLVQVKWPGGEALDLSYYSAAEVDQIINNSGHDNIWLTVKKANGVITTVPLTRQVMGVDENNIAGYILNGEKKIGYISLPGFYTSRYDEDELGCANDVAKEILKLQKENIEGLIIDLRYNGGGSLYEAIGLTGIFIDQGPLFMAKDKYQKISLMKDQNRGTIYDRPLLIMVNGFSASASELVTAGLRDYNRALVVGSNTFGKATAQITFPLDADPTSMNNLLKNKNNGYLNITVKQLYRISGNTYQKTGITPDIMLPDLYSSLSYGEGSESYAMPPDKVEKKVYYSPFPPLPIAELEMLSRKRTEQEQIFTKINELSDSLQTAMATTEVLKLSLDAFREYEKKDQRLQGTLARLQTASAFKYNVLAAHYDEALIKSDNFRKELVTALIKKTQEDIYIEEAYSILNDLINSIKK